MIMSNHFGYIGPHQMFSQASGMLNKLTHNSLPLEAHVPRFLERTHSPHRLALHLPPIPHFPPNSSRGVRYVEVGAAPSVNNM